MTFIQRLDNIKACWAAVLPEVASPPIPTIAGWMVAFGDESVENAIARVPFRISGKTFGAVEIHRIVSALLRDAKRGTRQ